MKAAPPGRILVIKLAALGDLVQAFEPFAAIRAHHPGARITLLTTPAYAGLARRSPWFDEVWDEGRPGWTDLPALLRLRRRLRAAGFTRVYDLQTSARSSRYRWLLPREVAWSGIARGASHPHANPRRDFMHTAERQREQLEMAGIRDFPAPALDWLDDDVSGYGLPEGPTTRFALLVPGASPGRPGKRWPVERFGELAAGLGMPCAVVGGPAEAGLAASIAAAAPGTVDLTGRTSFLALGAIARRAAVAAGNDTGPTHLVVAAGCPTVVLFGPESDPALCAPRGRAVTVLRADPIGAIGVEEVLGAVRGVAVG